MTLHRLLVALSLTVVIAGCDRSAPAPAPAPAPAHGHEPGPAAAAAPDCAALTGANPVQTEMRRLECALQGAVVAIGRDDLPSIAHAIHVVHQAKQATGAAIESGAWKPAQGDLAAFVALDETFHHELEALVMAAQGNDHAGAAAALGRALGQCQGCHAAFRAAPVK